MQTKTMLRVTHFLTAGALVAGFAFPGRAQVSIAIPHHDKPVPLFNGKNFDGFDILLEKHGLNNDPDKVFQVEKGVLHISGEEFGGLVTQKEYGNYYLRAEFRWGEKMYPPRMGSLATAESNTTSPARSKCGRR